MKHSKTGIPSITTSTLMLVISMAMVGCGFGSGGNTGSNSGGTDGVNALNLYWSLAFSKVRPIN